MNCLQVAADRKGSGSKAGRSSYQPIRFGRSLYTTCMHAYIHTIVDYVLDHSNKQELVDIEYLDANYKALLKGPIRLLQVRDVPSYIHAYIHLIRDNAIYYHVDGIRADSPSELIYSCPPSSERIQFSGSARSYSP